MKAWKWAALAALVLVSSSAEAMEVRSYPVDVAPSQYVAYNGDNPAFKGGFPTGFGSAIAINRVYADGGISFYGLTDRGPNGDAPDIERGGKTGPAKYFLAPDFQPEIALLYLKDGKVTVQRTIGLTNSDGSKISGRPLTPGKVGATGETALTESNGALPYDDNGLDPEGLAVDAQGHFWVADEYGPFVAEFDQNGKLLRKYAPGAGLPVILKYRTPNRGIEGLTITPNGTVVAMEQSTLTMKKDGFSSKKTAAFTRLIFLDPRSGAVRTYAYPINRGYKSPGKAKLGDIVAVNDHTFLIIEQGKDASKVMQNRIYKVDVTGADDITNTVKNGLTPEFYENGGGIRMARKELLVDLRAHGWTAEKAEGLTLLPDHQTIAVINDNDFGVAVDVKDPADPKAEAPDYVLHEDGTYTRKGKPASPTITFRRASEKDSQTNLFLIKLDEKLI